ncbi:geranylgeranylglyceryl/heptaprenylglyceryl phosphate synthase [candidate division WOR-3 bacterium]|nr:geranylgeranylglyceryl/heptaprenylglyceryl phosphate synthase [candidate division WOR-3 bacterium]
MTIYQKILSKKKQKEKMLFALLDPDSENLGSLERKIELIEKSEIDFILVGGSTSWNNNFERFTEKVKSVASKAVIIFPGSAEQISSSADAILFLSLISGKNPKYLIEEQIKAAPILKKTDIEVIPTGYILLDGGRKTTVEFVSGTKPISQDDVEKIKDTAYAAQLLGMKMVYLECGSGARYPVKDEIIKRVKEYIEIPLVVGGGIKDRKEIDSKHRAGADIVVVGNALEDDPTILLEKK